MLHILLLILKIIGVIIGTILGILVLSLCIVLFVPLRYEIVAKSEGSLKSMRAKAKVTWFFHLIHIDIIYKNSQVRWKLKAAWIKRTSGQGNIKKAEKKVRKETKADEEELHEAMEEWGEEAEKIEEVKEDEKDKAAEAAEKAQTIEKDEKASKEPSEIAEGDEEKDSASDEETGTFGEDTGGQRKSIGQKIKKIFEKIKDRFLKIKFTFQRLCDKIKALLEKKDKIIAFIQDEDHRAAFVKVKKEMFRLLFKLRPEKADIRLCYGFGDPCLTGQVLAGLSILYPFVGECMSVVPDFENKVLKGTVYVKGKIRFVHAVVLLWNLVWSKSVRITYRHVRNFELN